MQIQGFSRRACSGSGSSSRQASRPCPPAVRPSRAAAQAQPRHAVVAASGGKLGDVSLFGDTSMLSSPTSDGGKATAKPSLDDIPLASDVSAPCLEVGVPHAGGRWPIGG